MQLNKETIQPYLYNFIFYKRNFNFWLQSFNAVEFGNKLLYSSTYHMTSILAEV